MAHRHFSTRKQAEGAAEKIRRSRYVELHFCKVGKPSWFLQTNTVSQAEFEDILSRPPRRERKKKV